MDKTAQLVVGVLLVAFVIERVIAAVTFFLDPMTPAERNRKLLVLGLSGVLAAVALLKVDIRLMRDALNLTRHPRVDFLLTWLIIVGGADRIATFAGSDKPAGGGAAPATTEKQLPVTIVVEERNGKLTAVQEP